MASEKTCAVTGASGYVGGRIKLALERDGWRVIEWRRRADAGKAHVRFQLGDDVAPESFAGTRALVHCAYDFNVRSGADIAKLNVQGSEKLLRAARAAGVEQIVFISSVSAFPGCRSLYGRAKLQIEAIAQSVGAAIIRPGLVYGDAPGGVFGGLVKQVKRSKAIPLLGGGEQLQYLVHEEDLGRLVVRAVNGEIAAGTGPITLAHEKGRTLRNVLEELGRVENKRLRFVPVPWRLVWLGLKMLETLHLPAPFRSDSLIGLVYQDPAPSFALAKSLGAACRPFQASRTMLGSEPINLA